MPAYGTFECFLGPRANHTASAMSNGVTTFTMPTANNGWAARFMAYDTRDIKSVHVNFSTVSSPGSVEARIETIDATSGKPTGTLYDANATKTFTPAAGWNTVTFDTLPTTGLNAGTVYALVLLKTDTGTTATLNARAATIIGFLPTAVLTATDISTRSNFAEIAGSVPIAYFTLDDDAIETLGCCPVTTSSTEGIYGSDRVIAQTIVLPVDCYVRGLATDDVGAFSVSGTPAGDLRVRLLGDDNTALLSRTIDKDYLANISNRGIQVPFTPTLVPAGTYRIAFDSASSANASNCYNLKYFTLPSAALQSSAYAMSVSTNASTSFTWTNYTDRQCAVGLMIDSLEVATSGGMLVHPGMSGRIIY